MDYSKLLPIHIYILLHLKRANVDYAKMIAKVTDLDLDVVKSAIEDLVKLGLIERDHGSALKRSKARFKKAFEVHKHHTYYKLSREGEITAALLIYETGERELVGDPSLFVKRDRR